MVNDTVLDAFAYDDFETDTEVFIVADLCMSCRTYRLQVVHHFLVRFVACLCAVLCAVDNSGIATVERLFSSNLVVTVLTSLPNVLRIHHFRKGTEICRHKYQHAIVAVQINPSVCTVCF